MTILFKPYLRNNQLFLSFFFFNESMFLQIHSFDIQIIYVSLHLWTQKNVGFKVMSINFSLFQSTEICIIVMHPTIKKKKNSCMLYCTGGCRRHEPVIQHLLLKWFANYFENNSTQHL